MRRVGSSTNSMLRRVLRFIFLVLILSAGSESRPLKPRIVRDVRGISNWTPILPIAEEGGQRDAQRLSPGGPDPHHH